MTAPHIRPISRPSRLRCPTPRTPGPYSDLEQIAQSVPAYTGPQDEYLLARQPNGAPAFNIRPFATPPAPFGGYTPISGPDIG